jgi:hypothetical protein
MQLSAVGVWGSVMTFFKRVLSLLMFWPTPQLLSTSLAFASPESELLWKRFLNIAAPICGFQTTAELLEGGPPL